MIYFHLIPILIYFRWISYLPGGGLCEYFWGLPIGAWTAPYGLPKWVVQLKIASHIKTKCPVLTSFILYQLGSDLHLTGKNQQTNKTKQNKQTKIEKNWKNQKKQSQQNKTKQNKQTKKQNKNKQKQKNSSLWILLTETPARDDCPIWLNRTVPTWCTFLVQQLSSNFLNCEPFHLKIGVLQRV